MKFFVTPLIGWLISMTLLAPVAVYTHFNQHAPSTRNYELI